MKDEMSQELYNIRHSAAHLLAQAVTELYPGTKLTIGPVTQDGFFYDFLPTENFKEEDLPKIEQRMRELSKKNYKIEGGQVPKDEARKLYPDNPFKNELIDNVEGDTVGIYYQGDFFDLCKGGHVDSTKKIKHFKLTGISGSYWRADREGQPLQRISGIAFASKEDLEDYLKKVEEARLNDHRRLGKQLDLFTFHEEAAGFPFFHPKGTITYNKLIEYSRNMQKDDYQEIKTPLIMDESIWHKSGHYQNYKDNMYFTEVDEIPHCVRPMNCPSSFMVYAERPRSYRELPLRYAEYGLVHRKELSGVLHGLFRVRGFTQDDAHIYCTEEQLQGEVQKMIALAQKYYQKFGFKNVKMFLSTRPKKSMGTDEMWKNAEDGLRDALDASGIAYEVDEGGGAFYGPKIDMQIEDAMGRTWQCGTVQVDFNGPINFDLEYIDSDQSRKRPVVIHRALFGSVERFMGILLEHFKGHLPFFITPLQARVLLITDSQRAYAEQVAAALQDAGVRIEVDESGDQIGAQIRRAQVEKLPWMLVVGKKEVDQGTVTLRHPDGKQEFGLKIDELIKRAEELSAF